MEEGKELKMIQDKLHEDNYKFSRRIDNIRSKTRI